MMDTGLLEAKLEQWVIRTAAGAAGPDERDSMKMTSIMG